MVPPSVTVTPIDNQRAWQRQKEGISSDPSGLTFSHHKAFSQNPYNNQVDAILRSLPYQYGFTPQLWTDMTDVELLKTAGVFDITKMQTIVLMNAKFNMNNKKLGREMMYTAEHHGTIAKEQFGSRKNHRSVLALL